MSTPTPSDFPNDPLGLANKLRAEFDAMLDRLEDAVNKPSDYGFMDVQADTELTRRFFSVWRGQLTPQEYARYQDRLTAMRKWDRPGRTTIF